jgi:serine/threonine protein kinase
VDGPEAADEPVNPRGFRVSQRNDMSDRIPERIAHYEIVRLIGRGGMGVLYQARDADTRREVALKVMSPDILEDEEARARFRQEAQLAARHHRNIVKVFEFGEDADVPFIAMEFLRGRSLADQLSSGELLSLDRKLDVLTQVCDGLQCLHEEGIVHRDVKPANIWLLEDGGVKLLDLGIAKHGSLKLTQYGNVVGSVAYIAPEQLSGQRVDGRADIFSAGVVLYEVLSGQRPFHADSITAVMMKVLHEPPPDLHGLVPGLPDDVTTAVETALQKDPAQRYSEAAEFASDLRLARAMLESTPTPPLRTATLAVPTVVRATMPIPRAATDETIAADETIAVDETMAADPDPMLHSRPNVPAQPIGRARAGVSMTWMAIGVAAAAAIGVAVWLIAGRRGDTGIELDVRSTPPGAAISVDGAPTGKETPDVLSFASRPARVALTLDGYESVDAPVEVAPGSRAVLTYTLHRLLRVQSDPPGARIVIGGSDTGRLTPWTVPIRDRNALVELRLERYEPAVTPITAAMVETGTLNVRLARETGHGAATTPPRLGGGASPPPGPAAGPSVSPGSGVPRQTDVRVSGSYRFEVSGCGRVSPAAETHLLRVTAPCRLHLGASAYWLDSEFDVVGTDGGEVDIPAPPLANVELRTRNLDCTLFIGDRRIGPPPAVVQIVAGMHVVVVKCAEKDLKTKPFEIRAGKYTQNIDAYLY